MKKNYYWTIAALFLLFVGGLSSCVEDKEGSGGLNGGQGGSTDKNALAFKFAVDMPLEIETYADTQTQKQIQRECRVKDVFTLYFKPVDADEENSKFMGYSQTGVEDITITNDNESKGTYSVSLPASISLDDKLDILVLANVDEYINKEWGVEDKELTTGQYLSKLLEGKTYGDAIKELKLYFTDKTGFGERPLPMSGLVKKEAGKDNNEVDVTLTRRVARVDLVNESLTSGTDGSIKITSVALYNAAKQAYAHQLGPVIPFKDDPLAWHRDDYYIDYDKGVLVKDADNDINTAVKAKLYAFPNFVREPSMTDRESTCLIIGGYFTAKNAPQENTTKISYYRLNVNARNAATQQLNSNGLYTLNIRNVKTEGATRPDVALGDPLIHIDYTINEWDDSLLGTHVFDQYGNSLAASSRIVSFGNKGNQEITIRIYAENGDIKPIRSEWIPTLEGSNPEAFEIVSYDNSRPEGTVTIKTLSDNLSLQDLISYLKISWADSESTIELNIELQQLSAFTTFRGITVTPKDLVFSNEAGTKEVVVNTQGNFKDIEQSDIKYTVVEKTATWAELEPITQTPKDKELGLFRYKVSVESNPITTDNRKATIRFVISDGKHVATAESNVVQTVAWVEDGSVSQLNLKMYIDAEGNGNYLFVQRSNIIGLPDKFELYDEKLSMLFAQAPKATVYYELSIKTKLDWTLTPLQQETGDKLKFTTLSANQDDAGMKTTVIRIEPKKDALDAWYGSVEVRYSNGKTLTMPVAQEGTYGQIHNTSSSDIYFYGLINTGDVNWLDRNIGESKGAMYEDEFPLTKTNSSYNLEHSPKQAIMQCPNGYRLPTVEEAQNLLSIIELDGQKNYKLRISERVHDAVSRINYIDDTKPKFVKFSPKTVIAKGGDSELSEEGAQGINNKPIVALMTRDENTIAYKVVETTNTRTQTWTNTATANPDKQYANTILSGTPGTWYKHAVDNLYDRYKSGNTEWPHSVICIVAQDAENVTWEQGYSMPYKGFATGIHYRCIQKK